MLNFLNHEIILIFPIYSIKGQGTCSELMKSCYQEMHLTYCSLTYCSLPGPSKDSLHIHVFYIIIDLYSDLYP